MQPNLSIGFFDENEYRVNQIVVKLYSLFTFAGPVMLAARYFNIFPKADYLLLGVYTFFFAVSSVFLFWFVRRVPYARYTKYITLGALELLVIFLSIMTVEINDTLALGAVHGHDPVPAVAGEKDDLTGVGVSHACDHRLSSVEYGKAGHGFDVLDGILKQLDVRLLICLRWG